MPSETIPSTPEPQTAALWGGYIRTAVAVAGGLGLGVGTLANIDAGQWSTLISAGTPIAGLAASGAALAWSRWQRYRDAKLDHEGSVISAKVGIPRKAVS